MAPHGQHLHGTLVIVGKHRPDHIPVALWLDDIEQWMQCPIGVPQGEYGIVLKASCLMNILIEAPVFSVNILIDDG